MRLARRYGWEIFLVVLIFAAVLINTAISPYYLDLHQILRGLRYVAIPGILALGLAPIVIMAEIDISLTSLLAVGTVLFGWLSTLGVPVVVAIPIVLFVGGLAGLVNGAIVTSYALPSMAVTLGTMAAFRGLAYLLPNGEQGYASTDLGADYKWLGSTTTNIGGLVPVSLVVFILVAILVAVLMHWTVYGRLAFATGANKRAARYSGTRVNVVLVSAYVLAGALTMIASLLFVGYSESARGDNGGEQLLFVVTCVALGGIDLNGGRGTITGALLSVLLLGTLYNGMGLANIDAPLQVVVFGILLISAILLPRLVSQVRRWTRARGGTSEVPAVGT
jgi:rhamnose transport system permease protein